MSLTKISIAHRIGAALFALLMWTMAYLQLNDPDPILWVMVYCFLGLNATLGALLGVQRTVVIVALAITVLWSLWLSPSVYELFAFYPASDIMTGMSPDRPYVEEARESLGLLIGALAMGHLVFASGASRAVGGGSDQGVSS